MKERVKLANTTIKQHVPIFVSSTYEDLIPYREEVQRVLTRLEQVIKGMEYFGSSPQSSLETCLAHVRECKIYIGIIGMRYGSIYEDKGLSYSQLEYEEAVKCHIPTLIYIIDENHPIPPKFVDTGEAAQKLLEFKSVLKKRHTVSFFTTPNNLAEKISQDIIETLSADKLVELNIVKTEKEDFNSVFRKYLLRPLKYYGQEGNLTMKIDGQLSGITLKYGIISSFGLTLGDTVSTEAYVLDKTTLLPLNNTRKISLYADKEQADWLMDIPKNSIIEAKVKLSHCTIKEITPYDGGNILRDVTYTGLILLEGVLK